jgi:hypothetical protein
MGDPHRLLSKLSDGDDLERELLASIERADPPAHAKAEAWALVSAQIAAAAAVSTASSAAAAPSSAAAPGAKVAAGVGAKSSLAPAALQVLSAKTVIAIAVAGAAIASALWLHARAPKGSHALMTAPPPVESSAPVGITAASAEPVAPEPAAAAVADPSAVVLDTAAKPNVEQRKKDQLSAESTLLTQARAALRKGDARGAEQLLNRLQAQFPKGVLGQEREVLAIEVLAARGNAAAAKRRAQAFIAAYPESPHSAQLSRFTDAP